MFKHWSHTGSVCESDSVPHSSSQSAAAAAARTRIGQGTQLSVGRPGFSCLAGVADCRAVQRGPCPPSPGPPQRSGSSFSQHAAYTALQHAFTSWSSHLSASSVPRLRSAGRPGPGPPGSGTVEAVPVRPLLPPLEVPVAISNRSASALTHWRARLPGLMYNACPVSYHLGNILIVLLM